MKIILDNINRYPRYETCEHCGSEIKLEGVDDLVTANFKRHVWRCPCCGDVNYIWFNV